MEGSDFSPILASNAQQEASDGENKWCPRCQQYLAREQFYHNTAKTDGQASYCKVCWKAHDQEFQTIRQAENQEEGEKRREEKKRCTRCKEVKSISEFYKNQQWIDGLHVYCKKCVLTYQKEKREQKLILLPGAYRWKRDLICHNYFSQIDTPIKAYILGVLAADGNVLEKHHRITLELSAKDADLLALVRDELVPGGAITHRHRKNFDYQILAFVSRPMISDLAVLGIIPVKSCILAWPEKLPALFAREFILGYFDGDGFVTYNQRPNGSYPYLGFTSGSFDFLVRIADIIEQDTGIRPGGPWSKKDSKAYTMRASGKSALIIDRWLHASGLGLKRKRLIE